MFCTSGTTMDEVFFNFFIFILGTKLWLLLCLSSLLPPFSDRRQVPMYVCIMVQSFQ